MDWLHTLFSSGNFMPHGHCYMWNPGILWMHILSDALVFAAYVTIPITMIYIIKRRGDVPFNLVFYCFGIFIVACGLTHLMEIIVVWTPIYWLAGLIKVVTALASVATAVLLIRLIPAILQIPNRSELEIRVQERTAELLQTTKRLEAEIIERNQVEARLQAQLARFDLLNHITRATGERQDLHSIFQVVIRSLEDHLPIDFCCICLYDQNANVLTVTSVGARSEALIMALAMPVKTSLPIDQNGLARCIAGHLVYEPDIRQVPFPFPQRLTQVGLQSLVVAPLRMESTVFGVLITARRQAQGFSSGDCEFLRQLSEHVALTVNHAQLYASLQHAYDDLRQTQQAVMQQEHLRVLGQMASGIAHDINNAISPVALYTESLLEKEPDLSRRGRDHLEIIKRSIEDVAQTIARMREFYRQREPQLTLLPVALNELVQQVLDLTRVRWCDMPQQRGIVINVETDLTSDLPPIMGIASEIREALVNLIFNAVDAMPAGGTLRLHTGLASGTAGPTGRPPSQHVFVDTTDTGAGMDDETRRRCLEPFFTTKGERGTGLGLAMVYGVAQRHGAEIEIKSQVGSGTTIRLGFPLPVVTAVPDHPPVIPQQPSRLRILIVDDDPLVLKSLSEILEGDGHLVSMANLGQAGIDAFAAALGTERAFALVMTDLGMPYVDGYQVAAAVKRMSASTPVILLTGWGQRLVTEGHVPTHVDYVLGKPPKLRELRDALAWCSERKLGE